MINPIAYIRSPFPTKFGIPRQPGLVPDLKAEIIFEPEYRIPEAFRGLEGYSHIWLIWEFHEAIRDKWSPTVRPPRLGGNKHIGVFATRSPFRPNPIGISVVEIDKIELDTPDGPIIHVKGADLVDNTPIYDIKPYLPHIDSIPYAKAGFSEKAALHNLNVVIPSEILDRIPSNQTETLKAILSQDPRPGYQRDSEREYGFFYAGMEIKFRVDSDVLTVTGLTADSDNS